MDYNWNRKICRDGRRRPINKVIFESWCYVIKNLPRSQVECLICNRIEVERRYMDLCEDNGYLYQLKAPDLKNVYSRIEAVQRLADSVV